MDDHWNMDVTIFELLNKDPPEGHMWAQGRLTKKQVTTRPGHIWPEEWSKPENPN